MTTLRRILLSPPFRLRNLWRAGEAGIYLAAEDLAYVWQESTQVTPGAVNSPVGYAAKKGGNIPGLFQATAAARPTLSQRVNLLTKSEQLSNAVWVPAAITLTENAAVGPDGVASFTKMEKATIGEAIFRQGAAAATGFAHTYSATAYFLKDTDETRFPEIAVYGNAGEGTFWHLNTKTGATVVRATVGAPALNTIAVTDVGGIWKVVITLQSAVTTNTLFDVIIRPVGGDVWGVYNANALGTTYAGYVQLEIGSTASRYQRVNTASDYDVSGFPYFWSHDGTDDGLASAAFAAGTLTSNMDCFIAVKRNSAAQFLLMSNGADTVPWVGVVQSGDAGSATASAGTPTYAVDGVAVPGGTATTRDQLHTALTVGPWHILEARNLDLSAMTKLQISQYPSGFFLNGNIAGIVLCPSQTDARRAQIRREINRDWNLGIAGL